jgi:L-2-hydroxyglutarate oxidase LhgO
MNEVDAVVIGAGAVGLACGVALARTGLEVLVLEKGHQVAGETSSRSSEVIHAGIYYPAGSLKARLCIRGRDLIYEYCAKRGVPHRMLGKLIFASSDQELPQLEQIAARADAAGAGAGALLQLTAAQARRLEPELRCVAVLHSPLTGIFDSHAFAVALHAELDDLGGQVVCSTHVTGAERARGRWLVRIAGEDSPVLAGKLMVNAAGLHATTMAHGIAGLSGDCIPEPVYARGCYFGYDRRVPFRHLIYPVPAPGGLGTHLTLDLAGRARFGPNVEWIDTIDYAISPALHGEFVAAARKIWPGLDPAALHPDYAGVRPKVRTAEGISADFIVQGPEEHGLPGLVNLFGIESPGLTASLALGELVAARLADD